MPFDKVKLNLTKNQKTRLAKAIIADNPITIRLTKNALKSGPDILFLTKRQQNKLAKAKANNAGADLSFSKRQLGYHRARSKKSEMLDGDGMNGKGIGAVLGSLAPMLVPLGTKIVGKVADKIFGKGDVSDTQTDAEGGATGPYLPGHFAGTGKPKKAVKKKTK